jgi:GH18 family chitinase
MCIKGEQYEFGYLEIVYFIRKLFNKTVDNALKDIYYTYFSPNVNIGIITHILYSPASITTHTKISEIKNDFNAEDLQKQIDALESLKVFTEPKQLSRSNLLKLKRLAVDPQGVFQAAQLYEML